MSKKITYEVEAPASGILRIVAQTKESRKVTEVLASSWSPASLCRRLRSAMAEVDAVPTTDTVAASPGPSASGGEKPREVRSSPAARRLARELDVDITRVQGSGRGRSHQRKGCAGFPRWASRASTPPLWPAGWRRRRAWTWRRFKAQGRTAASRRMIYCVSWRGGLRLALFHPRALPFAGMRQAIAETMVGSLHSMAQLTLTSHADVTALAGLRDMLRRRWEARISYTDLIVKAVAAALRDHPLLNSTLMGEQIVLHDEINIGVAVALDQGLIVPVVREADKRSILEIHQALRDLAERARGDQLTVDEVTGGTFTVTNLGMYRVDAFTPIVNPPEVAILGVGQISEHLALVDGQVTA